MLIARFVVLGIALAFVSLAGAQTTYRWIDKTTGQTVYSDQPPPPGAKVVEAREGKAAAEGQQLPYAVRQAAEKYPVTLYTSANCTDVCASARSLLNGRGIPFTEKLITSQEEYAEVAKQMGNESFIPGLLVGSQKFAGFETASWNNLLDLAGYPRTAPYRAKPSGVFSQ